MKQLRKLIQIEVSEDKEIEMTYTLLSMIGVFEGCILLLGLSFTVSKCSVLPTQKTYFSRGNCAMVGIMMLNPHLSGNENIDVYHF